MGAVFPGVKCPHPTNQRYVILETKMDSFDMYEGSYTPG